MSIFSAVGIEGSIDYEARVEAVLKRLESNPVGEVILGGIRATKKDVTVQPYIADSNDRCNAAASAKSPRDAAPDGVRGGQKGAPWYVGDSRNPDRQQPWKAGRGTGRGSDAIIKYSPDALEHSSCVKSGPGSRSDEVLLHELVHALRMTQGKLNSYPTDTSDGMHEYDSEEEFLAIAVTNVYISSKGAHELLRHHHRGHRHPVVPCRLQQDVLGRHGRAPHPVAEAAAGPLEHQAVDVAAAGRRRDEGPRLPRRATREPSQLLHRHRSELRLEGRLQRLGETCGGTGSVHPGRRYPHGGLPAWLHLCSGSPRP